MITIISFSVPIKGIQITKPRAPKERNKLIFARERMTYNQDTHLLILVSENGEPDIPFTVMGHPTVKGNTICFNGTDFEILPAGKSTLQQEIHNIEELIPSDLERIAASFETQVF